MPDDITKRLHYFDKQFLVESDFTDEQKYHLDRRRRHNRLLHTPGIAYGLEVQKTAAKAITVSPGTAIDVNGQEIVQLASVTLNLDNPAVINPLPGANSNIYVTIAYSETQTDPQPVEKPLGNTRITEQPIVKAQTTPPSADGTVISLATFTLDGTGNIPGNVGDKFDGGVRTSVGSVLADNAISINKLKKQLVQSATITLGPGANQEFLGFKAPLSAPSSAFLLIYAYSTTSVSDTTKGFTWEQRYFTGTVSPDTSVNTYQFVRFRNLGTDTITIKFKIYAVLES
jgi:hypothetical protein